MYANYYMYYDPEECCLQRYAPLFKERCVPHSIDEYIGHNNDFGVIWLSELYVDKRYAYMRIQYNEAKRLLGPRYCGRFLDDDN